MTDEQFLQALYRGLLQREADNDGLSDHLIMLKKHAADPSRYIRLVTAFAESNEFRNSVERRKNLTNSNALLPDMRNVTFRHVASLGGFCHVAMALKNSGLRKWSGPFDWIFSNVPMVAHAIGDDFQKFLDGAFHRSVPLKDRVTPEANFCHHEFYRDQYGVGFVFNHRDPASVPADAEYYKRAVSRLRQVLQSSEWKLFIICSADEITRESLSPLLGALDRATNNYFLLALQFQKQEDGVQALRSAETLKTERISHNLLKVKLQTLSASDGVQFSNELDNQLLCNLLKSFSISSTNLEEK